MSGSWARYTKTIPRRRAPLTCSWSTIVERCYPSRQSRFGFDGCSGEPAGADTASLSDALRWTTWSRLVREKKDQQKISPHPKGSSKLHVGGGALLRCTRSCCRHGQCSACCVHAEVHPWCAHEMRDETNAIFCRFCWSSSPPSVPMFSFRGSKIRDTRTALRDGNLIKPDRIAFITPVYWGSV